MTNVANKPTTISEEQSVAIEANTSKRSYPETDENKLAGIEEGATVGADWNENLQNIPTILQELLTVLANSGVTHFDIAPNGTVLRLGRVEE